MQFYLGVPDTFWTRDGAVASRAQSSWHGHWVHGGVKSITASLSCSYRHHEAISLTHTHTHTQQLFSCSLTRWVVDGTLLNLHGNEINISISRALIFFPKGWFFLGYGLFTAYGLATEKAIIMQSYSSFSINWFILSFLDALQSTLLHWLCLHIHSNSFHRGSFGFSGWKIKIAHLLRFVMG